MSDDAGSEIDESEQKYNVIFADAPAEPQEYLSRDGEATATFANGDTYVGLYKDQKRHGFGTYTFTANHAQYKGDYAEGKRQGKGTFIAVDGSSYIGDWIADKREGSGMYKYANGDTYIGHWRNNAKHGRGVYTFANGGQTITGEWSNNTLMYGEWAVPNNGIRYIGKFHQNKPDGTALFIHPQGHKSKGVYRNGSFIPRTPPIQPSTGAALSNTTLTTIQPTVYQRVNRQIAIAVYKLDHFESIYRLKKAIDGVPNYRRIDGTNIYAAGQPTVDGYKAAIEAITGDGHDKVIWINLRNEPIVYVNANSFTPRHRLRLNHSLDVNGLTIDELHQIEVELMNRTRSTITHTGGIHTYYKDTFADIANQRKNIELTDSITDVNTAIRDQQTVFHSFAEDDGLAVEYVRLPIGNQRAPTVAEFDLFVEKLKGISDGSAIVFNCQMGKGRSSTAAAIALLINKIKAPEEEKEEEKEAEASEESDDAEEKSADNEDGETESTKPAEESKEATPPTATETANLQSPLVTGEYAIIKQLTSLIPNGAANKIILDELLTKAGAMQHLRDCIAYCYTQYNAIIDETDASSRRDFYRQSAINYIERYAFMHIFYAYLLERKTANDIEEFSVKFSSFVEKNSSWIQVIGTRQQSSLAEFDWK